MELILKGALISGSLIIAIGAQNAFVLKQGLLKRHVFVVALICFFCDALLMTLGVLGVGSAISSSKVISLTLAGLGAMFLIWYGVGAFRRALKSNESLVEGSADLAEAGMKKVVLATLAITLLNPHVYLDTVVIVGSVAGTMPLADKFQFLTGACLASFVWFFALAYGARTLLPLFRNPIAWKALEFFIACTMWWIAFGLLGFVVAGA